MSNGDRKQYLIRTIEGFSIFVKFIFLSILFGFFHLNAYVPANLKDKYQFGFIDGDFYYTSGGAGGGWMQQLKEAYSGTCKDSEWALRRSIVPGTMVDPKGTLFTTTLHGFGSSGPEFRLTECWYSNESGSIQTKTTTYYPWRWAYNSGQKSKDLNISNKPYLDGLSGFGYADRKWFRWCFHNVFHPSIAQEVNTSCSTCVRLLHYVPAVRLLRSDYKGKYADKEGIIFLTFKKTKLELSQYGTGGSAYGIEEQTDEEAAEKSKEIPGEGSEEGAEEGSEEGLTETIIDESDEGTSESGENDRDAEWDKEGKTDWIAWNQLLSRWSEERNYTVNGETKPYSPYGFSDCISNFQSFHDSQHLYLYHICRKGNRALETHNGFIHYNCYNRMTYKREGGRHIHEYLLQTACGIIPRFVRVGSYIYFATFYDGYWMRFYKVEADTSTVRNPTLLATCYLDTYVETQYDKSSHSPYVFDFCVLDSDGTPSTASSKDGDKIICVFQVGGGKGSDEKGILTEEWGWKQTYIGWRDRLSVRTVTGVLGSITVPEKPTDASEPKPLGAWSQNVIYVTDFERYDGNFVSITSNGTDNLGRENMVADKQRLYLNSHKIVPYTSPSGKHYIIYAYCYPGKNGRIYLGYAQYFMDIYRGNVLCIVGKTEFKEADETTAWGASFGEFDGGCNRIVSMDLRNGNLWITFLKENDKKYYYFHILAKDLIQE